MRTTASSAIRALAAGAGLMFFTAAQAGAQELPPAKEIIAKWAAAANVNGWKSHTSARATSTFDIPAMSISAKMELVQTFSPAMSKSKIDIPGMGEMWQGFDGNVMWSVNPMQGPTVMSGPQAVSIKEDNDPDNYSRTSAAIVGSETVEKTRLNETDCYKVKHTWKSGRISHDCFSVSDGLLVWSQAKVASPMGEAETTTNFSAYKDFGGMKRATTTTVEQGGQQFVITLNTWEWDTVTPKEMELPPEIKAMVDKKP
jgi:hypothetical protein